MKNTQAIHAKKQALLTANLLTIPCTSAAFSELSTEVLRVGFSLRFQAHGISMMPLVRDADILLVEPVDPSTLKIGEIVLCSNAPGHVVIHRIVQRTKGSSIIRFLVKGDRAATPDGWLSPDQIFGRLTSIERDGRTIHMSQPAMHLLNMVATWRTRYHLDQRLITRSLGNALKQMPYFCRFLS